MSAAVRPGQSTSGADNPVCVIALQAGLPESRALLNQVRELIEKIRGIMRAGRSFRMVLHAEDWQLLVAHSLHRAVIQIDVRYLYIGGERLRVHSESVILRSDGHFAGVQILYRLVGPAMAES